MKLALGAAGREAPRAGREGVEGTRERKTTTQAQ
jgi:hypothetical protein